MNGTTLARPRIATRRQKRPLAMPRPDRKGNIKTTREGWINCARVALIEEGIEGVKVDRLARRAKVTRGGFYHHFGHLDEVLLELLADWKARNRFTPVKLDLPSAAAAVAALDRITDDLVHENGFDPQFDMAVREWARISQPVVDVVHRVDAQRVDTLRRIFAAMGYAGEEALIRARVYYWHQVGYYAVGKRETVRQREGHLPAYMKVLAGPRYDGRYS